jgi:ligand-binding sensor domain-containing protein
MAFDAQGNLWGASWQAGFFITTPGGQVSQVSVDQGLPAEYNVSAIAPLTDGTAWIGLEEHGLARYEAGQISEILTAETVGFASDAVQMLFVAADGTLWVSVEGGLSHLQADGSWEHFGQDNLFDETFQWATDLAEDEQGGLWVTALGSGVYRLADGGWTHYVSGRQGVVLPSVDVHAVTLAPDGSIWFGTEGGAVHFDGEVWTPYRVKDGLIHPWVYDIYVEQTGTVWFATAGGAARWGP